MQFLAVRSAILVTAWLLTTASHVQLHIQELLVYVVVRVMRSLILPTAYLLIALLVISGI